MFVSEFLGYTVLVLDDERRAARAVIVSTSVNVVLNSILIPRYGLLAAAVMTVATEAILVGQYAWVLRALLRQFPWRVVLFRPVVAALLTGGILFVVHDESLVVEVVLGAVSYGALLLMLGLLGTDELNFVRSLRRQSDSAVIVG